MLMRLLLSFVKIMGRRGRVLSRWVHLGSLAYRSLPYRVLLYTILQSLRAGFLDFLLRLPLRGRRC